MSIITGKQGLLKALEIVLNEEAECEVSAEMHHLQVRRGILSAVDYNVILREINIKEELLSKLSASVVELIAKEIE